MITVIEKTPAQGMSFEPLFVVMIDTNCGNLEQPCWEENSDPQSLSAALDEVQEIRTFYPYYPCKIVPKDVF